MLLERGCELRILDDFSLGDPDRVAVPGVEILEGDVRDAEAVARAVEGTEAVIHLAAFGNVADSIADPLENFDVNARGTLVALAGGGAGRRPPVRLRLHRRGADRGRAGARRRVEPAPPDQPLRREQALR